MAPVSHHGLEISHRAQRCAVLQMPWDEIQMKFLYRERFLALVSLWRFAHLNFTGRLRI